MTKRILAFLCAAVLCFGVTGCSSQKEQNTDDKKDSIGSEAEEEKDMKGTVLTAETAKLVGRTYLNDEGTLWCGLSGSGAEFEFTGKNLDIMVEGDGQLGKENQSRIAIYVDGERVVDDMFDDYIKKYTPIQGDEVVTKTVKIVKLSETAMSCIGIMPLLLEEGASIKPAEAKAHRIEFIGDSITCGYGVDDEDPTHPFKTSTEDVTKAYAYKTAQNLDADYSMFSISGWGIISGYSGDGQQKTEQQIPLYYEKAGFSYGGFGSVKPQDIDWDFSKYQPELIVINLGTNDDSYCGSNEDRRQAYTDGYAEFLKTVRKDNPDARILCVLGIMGDNLYPSVEAAVAKYSEETGDSNISAFRLEPQNSAEDGLAADYHPTEATHTKAAEALTAEIKNVMGW